MACKPRATPHTALSLHLFIYDVPASCTSDECAVDGALRSLKSQVAPPSPHPPSARPRQRANGPPARAHDFGRLQLGVCGQPGRGRGRWGPAGRRWLTGWNARQLGLTGQCPRARAPAAPAAACWAEREGAGADRAAGAACAARGGWQRGAARGMHALHCCCRRRLPGTGACTTSHAHACPMPSPGTLPRGAHQLGGRAHLQGPGHCTAGRGPGLAAARHRAADSGHIQHGAAELGAGGEGLAGGGTKHGQPDRRVQDT